MTLTWFHLAAGIAVAIALSALAEVLAWWTRRKAMTRIGLSVLVAVLLAGCAVRPQDALQAPQLAASTRASSAPAPANAVCGCKEYFMPTYASWRESHRMWSCTVVRPRDGSAPTVPCTAWGLDRAPLGFEVNDQ